MWTVKSPSRRQRLFADSAIRNPQIDEEKKPRTDGEKSASSAGVEEPALFSEPGLFLIRPDRTLYFASVQTMPFARPHFADILAALDFVIAKNYPARGEVVNLPAAAA